MKTNPSVAIIIVNWNSYEFTVGCLNSLSNLTYKAHHIFLVDNASADGSGQQLNSKYQNHGTLTFIQNDTNLGFTGGNNVAIDRALYEGYEYIMLLNNDTEVEPNFLDLLVSRMESEPSLGAIQPLIFSLSERHIIWNAGGSFNMVLGLSKTNHENKIWSPDVKITPYTDWITGCCILTRKSVLRQIGVLDDKFFAYYEDVDWSISMKKMGYQLGLEEKSKIYHHAMASLKSDKKGKEGFLSPFVHYLVVRNHLYLIKKHSDFFNPIGPWIYQVIKLLGYSGYFILKGRFTKLRFALRGFKHGLKQ